MPYNKLTDGSRIWTAAKNGSINYQHFNELQDQLIDLLGERIITIPAEAFIAEAGWTYSTPPGYWSYTVDANQRTLTGAVQLQVGMKIISAGLVIKGSLPGAPTDPGAAYFQYQDLLNPGSMSHALTTSATAIWNLAGAYDIIEFATGSPHTVADRYAYNFRADTAYGGAAVGGYCGVAGAYVVVQMGS